MELGGFCLFIISMCSSHALRDVKKVHIDANGAMEQSIMTWEMYSPCKAWKDLQNLRYFGVLA